MHNTEKQKLIAVWCDHELMAQINAMRGAMPLSQFIRQVIVEYLESKGYEVDRSLIYPPDRAGKGGPKPKSRTVYPRPVVGSQMLNDVDPAVVAAAEALIPAAIREVKSAGQAPKQNGPIKPQARASGRVKRKPSNG